LGSYYSGANSNRVLVSGIDSRWNSSGSVYVGELGSGNQLLLQAGGSVIAAGSTHVGSEGGSNNLLHVDGGTLTVATNLDVRRGTLQLDSATVTAGTLLATNATLDGGGFITFNGGTLSVTHSTVDNGAPLVVGDGSSAATYELLGNGLHQFTLPLVITNNGVLTGSGTVTGKVTVASGGKIDFGTAPGAAGILALSNSPTLKGAIQMRAIKSVAQTTNDTIQIAGPLAYDGVLTVVKVGATALAQGDSFHLFNATFYTNAFSGISLPPLNPGLNWTNRLLVDGSIAVVNWTGPKLSGVGKSGTNLTFNVTDGVPGGAYELLTSTNIATPLTNWGVLDSGNFDWLGNQNISIPINPAIPRRFFTLHVP